MQCYEDIDRFKVSVKITLNFNSDLFSIQGTLNSVPDSAQSLSHKDRIHIACYGDMIDWYTDTNWLIPSFFYLRGKDCGRVHRWVASVPWDGSGLTFTNKNEDPNFPNTEAVGVNWCSIFTESVPDPETGELIDRGYEHYWAGGLFPPIIRTTWSKDPYSRASNLQLDAWANSDRTVVQAGGRTIAYLKIGRGIGTDPSNPYGYFDGVVFSWVAGETTLYGYDLLTNNLVNAGSVEYKLENRQ